MGRNPVCIFFNNGQIYLFCAGKLHRERHYDSFPGHKLSFLTWNAVCHIPCKEEKNERREKPVCETSEPDGGAKKMTPRCGKNRTAEPFQRDRGAVQSFFASAFYGCSSWKILFHKKQGKNMPHRDKMTRQPSPGLSAPIFSGRPECRCRAAEARGRCHGSCRLNRTPGHGLQHSGPPFPPD